MYVLLSSVTISEWVLNLMQVETFCDHESEYIQKEQSFRFLERHYLRYYAVLIKLHFLPISTAGQTQNITVDRKTTFLHLAFSQL